MHRSRGSVLAVAAAAVAVGAIIVLAWQPQSEAPRLADISASPSAVIDDARVEPPQSMLPALRMPSYGALGNTEPKDYGWTGQPGSSAGMHNVELDTEIVYAVERDSGGCFARGEGPVPAPTTVAGFDALYVEPYRDDRRARFIAIDKATTRAYALAIADRTLCVYLTWGPSTSPDELDAAREVLTSLRAQPFEDNGIRIVFTTLGWDNG